MFINFYELLKTIYTKEKSIDFDACNDWGICVAITRTLAKQKDNLDALSKIVGDLFVGSPKNYMYKLYCDIPRKDFVPKSLKIEKVDIELDKLEKEVQRIFGWSINETQKNKEILDLVLNKENKKFWKKELTV